MIATLRDLRFAVRTLTRSPWFTSLAAVILALGIGANVALFSLVDTVLFKTFPYGDPDRLVEIWGQDATRGDMRVPATLLDALRARSRTLDAVSFYQGVGGVLRTPNGAVDIRGEHVSANFLDVMGVPPMIGRGFVQEEEDRFLPSILISNTFWERYLGSSPEAVGSAVYLGAVPYTVIGIMPLEFRRSFSGDFGGGFWTTYVDERTRQFEREEGYEVVARLSDGATLDDLRSELASISATVTVAGFSDEGRTLGAIPLKKKIIGDSAYALQLLLAAVIAVLTMACANLAQLLLARSDGRAGEFAMRKAIGATSFQLFRQALLESLLLSIVAGIAGVVVAYALLPTMLSLAPADIPRIREATIDQRVLAVAIALSALTGCAFGAAPALRLSRLSVAQALARTSARLSQRNQIFRSTLVVGQVATSVTLFVLAVLLGRTFLTLLPSNPGFETESRSVFLMIFNPADRNRLSHELMRRFQALPGITDVAVASNIPFSNDEALRPVRSQAGELRADVRAISPNFFRILNMPLVRGREFDSDGANTPGVAIVNERLARALAPSGEVLGQMVQLTGSATAPAYQIVGVVADARSTGTSAEPLNEIYIPYGQSRTSVANFIFHSELGARELTGVLLREIRAAAPDIPFRDSVTAVPLEDMVRRGLAAPRFAATLIGAFSAMTLLLSTIGVFGLVAYSVSQRHREFGIRAALGASPRDLTKSSMRSAFVLSVVGIVAGMAAAAYLTRFVEAQLYGVGRFDPQSFGGAGLMILAVSCLAAYIPARRAGRTDPATVLRYE